MCSIIRIGSIGLSTKENKTSLETRLTVIAEMLNINALDIICLQNIRKVDDLEAEDIIRMLLTRLGNWKYLATPANDETHALTRAVLYRGSPPTLQRYIVENSRNEIFFNSIIETVFSVDGVPVQILNLHAPLILSDKVRYWDTTAHLLNGHYGFAIAVGNMSKLDKDAITWRRFLELNNLVDFVEPQTESLDAILVPAGSKNAWKCEVYSATPPINGVQPTDHCLLIAELRLHE
jgi:hypothetical protein